jgi:hypothetical protein
MANTNLPNKWRTPIYPKMADANLPNNELKFTMISRTPLLLLLSVNVSCLNNNYIIFFNMCQFKALNNFESQKQKNVIKSRSFIITGRFVNGFVFVYHLQFISCFHYCKAIFTFGKVTLIRDTC